MTLRKCAEKLILFKPVLSIGANHAVSLCGVVTVLIYFLHISENRFDCHLHRH